jgi:hypothetical protein
MRQLNKKRVVGLAGAARIVYAVAGLPGFFQVRYNCFCNFFNVLLLILHTVFNDFREMFWISTHGSHARYYLHHLSPHAIFLFAICTAFAAWHYYTKICWTSFFVILRLHVSLFYRA